jgi:hypothetical protein
MMLASIGLPVVVCVAYVAIPFGEREAQTEAMALEGIRQYGDKSCNRTQTIRQQARGNR